VKIAISFLLLLTTGAVNPVYCSCFNGAVIRFDDSLIHLHNVNYGYTDPHSDTISRIRFLWYPLKSIEDLFNFIPGYYLKFRDIGQVNPLYFNQNHNTKLYKNGIPFDDDINFLSRNEIQTIESDNGFGNSPYTSFNSVNFTERQTFTYRPFTEISFFQDRYENLFFDGSYSQNIFNNFNVAFGLTKHSYDGHYVNSDFDKWLGRIRLQYLPFKRLRLFCGFGYGNIERGEYGGLRADSIDITDKNVVFNRTRALVKNANGRIRKERFQLSGGLLLNWSRDNVSELVIYSNRKNTTLSNQTVADSVFTNLSYTNGNNGLRLSQLISFKYSKIKINSRTEVAADLPWSDSYHNSSEQIISDRKLMFMQEISGKFGFLTPVLYFKAHKKLNGNNNSTSSGYGIKAISDFRIGLHEKIQADIFYRKQNNYFRAKASFYFKYGYLSPEFYHYTDYEDISGVNFSMKLEISKINLELIYSKATGREVNSLPEHYGNINLFYEDTGFKNKLHFRIGTVSRFWSRYTDDSVDISGNFTFDFYIKGKIGRAYFGIVFENIFDRIIYNSGFYPFTDRGGLFNALSRFEIIWNFTD
jgi:hypothetical protein